MKRSILDEIKRLRGEKPLLIDYQNSNRYRLVIKESGGERTAYCFSTPIYHVQTRKLIDCRFHMDGSVIRARGSHADIAISRETGDIELRNAEGSSRMTLSVAPQVLSPRELRCGGTSLYPTANGIACRLPCTAENPYRFALTVDRPFLNVRANDKYVALMSERFRPFIVVSCIGTVNGGGQVTAPAVITYQKLSDQRYELAIRPSSAAGKQVLFEVNLYEPKLFQDTTVESAQPRSNNAFGGMAFLGRTETYGTQWLYIRPDVAKLSELLDKPIRRAVLHFPLYSQGERPVSAFRVSTRFCSFGSNWENKIAAASIITDATSGQEYMSVDVTELVRDSHTGYMNRSEGLILKPGEEGSGFTAIATGDNAYTPLIFEIRFR